MKTLEDWKDAYYEQQAGFTEARGMLAQERDAALTKVAELDVLLKQRFESFKAMEAERDRAFSYAVKLKQWTPVEDRLPEADEYPVLAVNLAGYVSVVTRIKFVDPDARYVGWDETPETSEVRLSCIFAWRSVGPMPTPENVHDQAPAPQLHAIDNSRPMTAKEIREEISNSPEHRFVPGVPRATNSVTREQLEAALKSANEVCRSAYQIAHRISTDHGDVALETNFGAFKWRVKESLALQHRAMYPDQYREDRLVRAKDTDPLSESAQGGTTERPFAHDPANPGINKGNEGPRF